MKCADCGSVNTLTCAACQERRACLHNNAAELLALLKELVENTGTTFYSSAIEISQYTCALDGEEWGGRAKALIAKAEGRAA